LFLRGSNLLDEDVRNQSSFIADVVPMPGRNISAGFRLGF
jgi:iron complex outermembrane receptor protein